MGGVVRKTRDQTRGKFSRGLQTRNKFCGGFSRRSVTVAKEIIDKEDISILNITAEEGEEEKREKAGTKKGKRLMTFISRKVDNQKSRRQDS